jgi:hypothetical protein
MLIYEHIPKCAGTSIVGFLASQHRNPYIINGRHTRQSIDDFDSLPETERAKIDFVGGHGASLCRGVIEPVYATVLRHPVDRVVSYYHYCRRDTGHTLHASALSTPLDRWIHRRDVAHIYDAYHTLHHMDEMIIGAVENIPDFVSRLGFAWDGRRENAGHHNLTNASRDAISIYVQRDMDVYRRLVIDAGLLNR